MTHLTDNLHLDWSHQFGLAATPLFERHEAGDAERHHVLMDGGYGTFALSISEDEIWRRENVSAWAWSADIPHHVTVTKDKVGVRRWDASSAEVFSTQSVFSKLDQFYRYLTEDRVRSNFRVVDHILDLFRRMRSLTHGASISDSRSVDVFLVALRSLVSDGDDTWDGGLAEDATELFAKLPKAGVDAALEAVRDAHSITDALVLHPALSVRHAGGQLFQEAHFEFLRAPSLDLFGHIGAPEVKAVTRGGAHFTPPALARIIAEQTLAQLPDLNKRREIVIADPACGSGAFLHEVLRTLRRLNYDGCIRCVGRDVSPAATAMARFVLSCAARDWQPKGGIVFDIQTSDALLSGAIPSSDIVVMNPPFISWSSQSPEQRAQYLSIMEGSSAARGDLSMAFVVRGIEALNPGGALGTLFPASLLSLRGAEEWRQRLLQETDVRFLSSIGDYGLFTYALVQVASAVLVKQGGANANAPLTALVTENDQTSTGNAFRVVRKTLDRSTAVPATGDGWSLFEVDKEVLKRRPTWRLNPPSTEAALRRLEESGLPRIADLFNVRRGVQTGLNDALLLSDTEWRSLPPKEKRFFRVATMSDSISGGRIEKPYYVFFPHDEVGSVFADEEDLKSAVPRYYKDYLLPNRGKLKARIDITRPEREDWWGLAYPREYSNRRDPRLISKYFSGPGGFVADVSADYVPVMGFAWFPKEALLSHDAEFDMKAVVLSAYASLFNSATFMRILRAYSPHVSGGQFDLSPRYANAVPVPNLAELLIDEVRSERVIRLAELIHTFTNSTPWIGIEEIVTGMYGREIVHSL